MRSHRRLRTAATGVLAVSLAAGLLGCGTERSEEAYCDMFNERVSELNGKYSERADSMTDTAEADPFLGLLEGMGTLLEAQGDLAATYEDLSKVAPPEIEGDVERLARSLRDQADATAEMGSDPLAGAVGGLLTGLQNMGPARKVNDFEVANCV